MIFALLTLLVALSLAAVAGWFSIVGFMAIYAGAPMYALIMGVVTECAKLVTTSWLYRNWDHADWRLKAPLIYFTLALMIATSIGVFGFLSKAHLEQTAGTLDNSSKIEQLQYQIDREKATIADNEKVTKQLDDTVNSLLGKDRADRALSVRKSQASQRAQLRTDSAEAQKRIDTLSAEKFKLESEVRALQLEVGPIRYIAEMIYGVEENSSKNIEAAVRIFTLLLVSTLDPLAVILLIAANHTLIRLRNEKKEKDKTQTPGFFDRFRKRESTDESSSQDANPSGSTSVFATSERVQEPAAFVPTPGTRFEEAAVDVSLPHKAVEVLDEKEIANQGPQDIPQSQIIDAGEGEWKLSFKDTLQETPVAESVGRIFDETRHSESEIGTEIQTPLPIIDDSILNEEQEPLPARSESNDEVPEAAQTHLQGISVDSILTTAPPTLSSEIVDQREAVAAAAEDAEGSLQPAQVEDEKETAILENFTTPATVHTELPVVRTPVLSRIGGGSEDVPNSPIPAVSMNRVPWAQQDTVLRELLGSVPHFAPQRLDEKEIVPEKVIKEGKGSSEAEGSPATEAEAPTLHSEEQALPEKEGDSKEFRKIFLRAAGEDKYPKALSWLTEFRRL